MRSRRWLWSFLVLGSLPFFLEATTGCDSVFGLQRIEQPADNGLYCDCMCEAGAAQSPLITMDSDDAEESSSGVVAVDDGDLDLGQQIVGLRFTGLMIPQGASIAHAYVQFEGDEDNESEPTSYTIRAEASTSAGTFTSTNGDLSGRMLGMFQVTWNPIAWSNGEAAEAERTADIADLIQELVDRPEWTQGSTIVLRFDGTGHRSAESHEGGGSPAQLIVDLGVAAVLPVCARSGVARNALGDILQDDLVGECSRVASTLTGIAGACGYPTPCSCTVVDRKDESGGDQPDSIESDVCRDTCDPVLVDAPVCDTFDPNEFSECIADGGTIEACKGNLSATHADGGSPVCVHSGSALAFHAFGERSLCEVKGVADIVVGDRRPTGDPKTIGRVEILGGPCPGGNCAVHPFLDLAMNPIEFEVRWASNPVFRDLSASARGLDTALLDQGAASFDPDTVVGTGLGRRGLRTLGIDAANPDPLDLGVDWIGRTCNVHGTLAAGVGNDGVCEADGATPCATDDDCAAVGGACTLPPETTEMLIGLALGGALVNQPPRAAAGADQNVECTSSAGATFTLDGRGTSDPDQNLALTTWHAGTRTGPELSRNPVLEQALGVGGAESYVLRVVDTNAQTDEDTTAAQVVDTTPPVIACNAPATIKPPDALISFGATATDVCDTAVTAEVIAYDCFAFTKKGRRISKLESCVVSFLGDTLAIHDIGGYGDHIQWTVRAPDDSGNVGQTTCEVVVAK
jgi:hypothetical protein